MTFIVALIIYFYFYLIWYTGALVVLGYLLNLILPKGGLAAIPVLNLISVGLLLVAFIVASRRAYHAAQAYGNRDLSFWEAHNAAGSLIRAQMAFLPFVGHLFGGERDKE